MIGCLASAGGVLHVGWHARSAHVRPFDWSARALGAGFSFRGARAGRSALAALAVDRDQRVWVADAAEDCVRAFNLFGRELARIELPARPRALCAVGEGDLRALWIASGEMQRTSVRLISADGAPLAQLRSEGEPRASFCGARRIEERGEWLYVLETELARIQVFRRGEHEWSLSLERGAARARPTCFAPIRTGLFVVGWTGEHSRLELVDGLGRRVRSLAPAGAARGSVLDPTDLALGVDPADGALLVAALDADGARLQIFDLDGRLRSCCEPAEADGGGAAQRRAARAERLGGAR